MELQRFAEPQRHAGRPSRKRARGHDDSVPPPNGRGYSARWSRSGRRHQRSRDRDDGDAASHLGGQRNRDGGRAGDRAGRLDDLATDTITDIVRQVARFANVEALRTLMSTTDSIPMKAVARDARGAVIADATVSIPTIVSVPFNPPWAGPELIKNVSVSVR